MKKTASIYDPFGFLTPFVVRAKMLMQEAWMEAIGWDEELPYHLKAEWKKWFKELERASRPQDFTRPFFVRGFLFPSRTKD